MNARRAIACAGIALYLLLLVVILMAVISALRVSA